MADCLSNGCDNPIGIPSGQLLPTLYKNGAVTLKKCAGSFFLQKKAARPRKNLAVGVKLMYDQTH